MSDSNLQKFFQYGTAAERAAFTPVPPSIGGTDVQILYFWYETDTGDAYMFDTTWHLISSAGGQIYKLTFVFDGGGSPLAVGTSVAISSPVAGTIVRSRLMADQSGAAVLDVWKDVFANYPPTVADTITAAAKPTLSAAASSEDTTLTGWTTAVAAGDVWKSIIDSVDGTIEWLVLEIWIQP